jgi:Flp pilus assembly protein TadG
LTRLARDRRGNVLALSAAALVPMMAMIGGAIDLSRLYMAKTRLQQACDAGALAGRRAMNDVNVLTDSEKDTAGKFFAFNFPEGTYSASPISAVFTRGDVGVVNGRASLSMPMTIMHMFGMGNKTLSVTCQSTLLIPNTDVMFVLDVTGSMAQTTGSDTVSKIDGLKQAVKDFFSALGAGAASGPGRIRYGFMPYSSNVNVGKIVQGISPSYIAGGAGSEKPSYRSRRAVTTPENYIESYGPETTPTNGTATNATTGSWSNQNQAVGSAQPSYTNVTQDACNQKTVPTTNPTSSNPASAPALSGRDAVSYPITTQTSSYTTTQNKTGTIYRYKWTKTGNGSNPTGTCQLQYSTGPYTTTTASTTTRAVNWAVRDRFVRWEYVLRNDIDVSPVVQNGTMTNPAYWSGYYTGTNPNADGAPTTVGWGGCIEEARTNSGITATSSLSIPSDAYDLQIDLKPNSADTRWKPFLRDIQYDAGGNWLGRSSGWVSSNYAACPRQASPLTQYTSDYVSSTKSSAAFTSYVDALAPGGFTTHDIGLIWGARFLSPDGIFSATNADSTGPGGYQISRHIVFMTDGTLEIRTNNNDAWGINNLEGRVAASGTDQNGLTDIHRRRVSMICNAMKGKGFTVWVVGFGITTMPQELQECASDSNHWSLSNNAAELKARFQAIAQTIGGLRLSQ